MHPLLVSSLPPTLFLRRRWLAAMAAVLLSACGGGGDGGAAPVPPPPAPAPPPPAPAPAPQVLRFEASSAAAWVGDSVELLAEYRGQTARIDPLGETVASGARLSLGPLSDERELRLVVSSPGHGDAERVLRIPVQFRDRYVRLARTWEAQDAVASLQADGTVLLLGGDLQGRAGVRIDRYRPATGGLDTVGALIEARVQPQVARLPDGSLLVVDGALDAAAAGSAERVDGASGRSELAGRLQQSRSGAAVLGLPDGRVLVAGGLRSNGGGIEALTSAEIWEPQTRSFRTLTHGLRTPRAGAQLGLLPDGRVLLVGGYGGGEQAPLAEIWDPATERFSPVNTALPSRIGHSLVTAPNGTLWVMGGRELDRLNAPLERSVHRFDPVTLSFVPQAPLRSARAYFRAQMLPSGQVLLFGGQHDDRMGGAERYDAATGGTALAALDQDRSGHALLRLPSGRLLIAGGQTPTGAPASSLMIYE